MPSLLLLLLLLLVLLLVLVLVLPNPVTQSPSGYREWIAAIEHEHR